MTMNNQRLLAILVLGWAQFAAAAAPPKVYDRPHDLLMETIKKGKASGVLVGEVDQHFTRQFRSTGPLMVDARVLQSLPREDCKRMEVTFRKKDVDTPKGRTDAILTTQLNYCLDGGPPLPESTAVGGK